MPVFFVGQVADAGAAEGTGEAVEGSGEAAGFAQLYEQYYGNYIVGIGAAVLLLIVVLRVVQAVTSVSKYGQNLPRPVRQQIRKYELAGNFGMAADLLFEGGAFEDAAEIYLKTDNPLRAAEAMEKAGNTQKAVALYRKANAGQLAGDAFSKRGQFALAAREYQAAELPEKAAAAFVKANDFRAAADIYRDIDRPQLAADAYERAGDKSSAAEMYAKHFHSQFDLARGALDGIREACEGAQKAAGWMEEAGDLEGAAALLRKAGFRKRSAELYTQLGNVEEAAQIYIEANRPQYAARLYDSVGEQEKALKFRAEAKLQQGDRRGAADDFAAAGLHAKAAELYNDLGESAQAAENYEKAGELRMAADIYKGIDDKVSAARVYEAAADFDQAMRLHRELGDQRAELRAAKSGNNYFRVGEIMLEHKRVEDALAAFQRVEPTDPRYEEANVMQGDLLRELGRHDVAFSKYKLAIGDQRPSKGNIELLYKMAMTAEAGGSVLQALKLFEKIIGVDYHFRDAGERAQRLRSSAGVEGMLTAAFSGGAAGVSAAVADQKSKQARPSTPQGPDRYKIEEEIARGGMGIVYRATDTVLERVVAYKILPGNLKTNEVAVKYFLREARAAARMSHPNIVTVFDAGEQGGEYYMAMEYVEGQTLKMLVTRQGAFPEKLVRYIMMQVCRGLAYAHERGLVHRDIKPGNLMLTKDRTVKIMDFGLAKFVEEVQAAHTRAIGTPYYMSPEQVVGKELDGRSDIYSLGVSMFECATGQVPFGKGDLSYHHLHTIPPRVSELNPKISEQLSDVIFRCMAKSTDARYRSVTELMAEIKE